MTLIVRICVIIGVILTLPLVHYPTRRAVDFVLRPGKPFSWLRLEISKKGVTRWRFDLNASRLRTYDLIIKLSFEPVWKPWHIGIMACLIGTCVILVILVPDIRDIFGFVGASSSSMLLFILPSMFYLKVYFLISAFI